MKYLKNILFLILIVFITYFGGGEKYIRYAVESLENRVEQWISGEDEVSNSQETLLEGTVVHVSDGDTVILRDHKGKKHRIRLDGIDAPEIGQDYGDESKNFVVELTLMKKVVVDVVGTDQYNRVLGILYIGKINVNEELLLNGLAWQYRFNTNSHYTKLVNRAKAERSNIWSNNVGLDPYVWRKQHHK